MFVRSVYIYIYIYIYIYMLEPYAYICMYECTHVGSTCVCSEYVYAWSLNVRFMCGLYSNIHVPSMTKPILIYSQVPKLKEHNLNNPVSNILVSDIRYTWRWSLEK